jgi:putative RNA 2'-phosphotransferase
MNRRSKNSRFLSLVLRHQPEAAGIALDAEGWVEVDVLLAGLASVGHPLAPRELDWLVSQSDKQRFAFSPDRRRIRASQGHSVPVDLKLGPAVPPARLFHGTVERFMESITALGLAPQQRHHVHLSADRHTAFKVGSRRGKAVVLSVDAGAMVRNGHAFFVSDNGVWLTDRVPPEFLTRLTE